MYHPRFSGTHRDMGVKRGKIFLNNHIYFPLLLDSFQINHGIESEKILRTYFPEVCEEIKGITDTMNIDYIKFISWMLAMGCCMYNLNNNIPEIRGCTAFVYSNQNEIFYGRNNDLPPYLKKGSKSELYNPQNGHSFILTTSSFINGEEGINDSKLVVAMTFVLTDLKNIKPGFNAVFIVRYLLEKAGSVNEALLLLKDLPVASNCNILLADSTGTMKVIEISPEEKNIREAMYIESGKVIITVNSFTSEKMKKYECTKENTYKSDERYNVVINSFKYLKDDTKTHIEKLLKGDFGFMCQYKKEENFETIWSSIININKLEIYRAENGPLKGHYIIDKRLKEKSENH